MKSADSAELIKENPSQPGDNHYDLWLKMNNYSILWLL